MQIRSGRFKSDDASANNGLLIVRGKKDRAIYRVFNSGTKAFTVRAVGSTLGDIPLESKQSLDVAGSGAIRIGAPSAGSIEGMYDFASEARPIRSGRFKRSAADAVTLHKVICLDGRLAFTAFYRFYNSSDDRQATFRINGLGANPINLDPSMSVDLAVTVANGQDLVISIDAATANYPIQGIYEYLGAE